MTEHKDVVWYIIISQNDEKIYSSSKDTTIKVWNLEKGTLIQSLQGHS